MTDRHGKLGALEREELRNEQLEVQLNSLKQDKDYFMGKYFCVAEERVALLAQVEELEAEAEEMASIFRNLCFWLNNGAPIMAPDPALPVFIGPELTTNLHFQGPLGVGADLGKP